MFTVNTHASDCQKGFTLIEMAMAMIILGLLIAPLFSLYTRVQTQERAEETFERIESAVNTLQEFRRINGFYPCPAPINLARNVAGYGAASNCRAGAIAALAPGDCAGGICVEQSVRALVNPRVIVGSLPFRDLQIEEQRASDGYGSRFVYAVTESMTDQTTFDISLGAISVRDASGEVLSSDDGNIAYLVLSPGRTQQGAYNKYGVLASACPAAGATIDQENCNVGFETGNALSPNSIYVSSFQANATGANFFDDQVMYYSQVTDPMWKRVDDVVGNPEDIEVLTVGDVQAGNPSAMVGPAPAPALDIGAGYNNGTGLSTNSSLAVRGVTQTGGDILTDLVCDENGQNCFRPRDIAGDPTPDGGDPNSHLGGMLCPLGQYMVGVENAAPVCRDIAFTCPDSRPLLVGVDGAGNPDCQPVPAATCVPVQTISNVCPGEDRVFNDTEGSGWRSGYERFGSGVGGCRDVEFECSNGTFRIRNADSALNCTDGLESTGNPCPEGTVGTYDVYRCSGDTIAADCACTDRVVVGPNLCVAPYIGDLITTTTYASDCSVSDATVNTCNCPAGGTMVGGGTEVACGADGGVGDVCRTISTGSCPSGYTGSPVMKQIYNTGSCDWDDIRIESGCTCDTTPVPVSAPVDCNAAPYNDAVCFLPDVNNTYERTVTDPPCELQAWPGTLITPGTCRPRGTTWVDQGANGAPSPAAIPGGAIRVGDSCSCSTRLGETRRCFLGTDRRPHDCICQ